MPARITEIPRQDVHWVLVDVHSSHKILHAKQDPELR